MDGYVGLDPITGGDKYYYELVKEGMVFGDVPTISQVDRNNQQQNGDSGSGSNSSNNNNSDGQES